MTVQSTQDANQQNVEWLLNTSLRRLVLLGLAVGLVWYGYLGFLLGIYDLLMWPGPILPILFVVSQAITYWTLGRFGYMKAATVYMLSVTLVILLTAWAYSQPILVAFLTLPAGAVTLLVGPWAGFGLATCFILVLFGASRYVTFLQNAPDIAAYCALFIGLTTAMVWVATYPLRTTIGWSWASYARARQQTEQTREHRAQLVNVTGELEKANERLKFVAAELERARQAANIARRLKSEFAANISHELRTPLNLIIGFSEMMVLAPQTYDTPLPVDYRTDVQTIYRNAKHLSNLIDDVLDLSQIEAGRMGLVKSAIHLQSVIEEAIAAVLPLFRAKQIELNTDIHEPVPVIEADRVRVRQVLINLLANAARYTDTGGVTITVTVDQQDVIIAVADTGLGIAEADVPFIFHEFRQLHGAVQHHAQSSGLGLAISRRFIEMHGGRMWVTSELGKGTTFSFRLPVNRELGVSMLPPGWETWVRLAPRDKGKKLVAIVDDGQTSARFFERYLDGYRVVVIKNIDDARRLLATEPLHALIATAPSGELGWSKVRTIRENLPALPILLCTLHGGVQVRQLAGVHDYLVKPVSEEKLQNAFSGIGKEIHHVLLIDDEPEVVRLLTRMVRSTLKSCKISRALNGKQALTLLHEEPDLIVLDLLMPEMDGYSVLEHMQDEPKLRHIPVVVVSAKGIEEEIVTAGLVGVTRSDGFSVGEVMRTVKANLDALTPPSLMYSDLMQPTATVASPVLPESPAPPM